MTRPQRHLLALAAAVLLVAADTTRAPQNQLTARTYLVALDGYRHYLHPLTHHFVRCRYNPTCSYYSRQAVERYGIVRGLSLTVKRLWSCKRSVPMGTYDPVPA